MKFQNNDINITLIYMQVILGTIIPLIIIGFFQVYKPSEKIRKVSYFIVGICVLIGIFFMRWNVVIGGQLFSKSFAIEQERPLWIRRAEKYS